MSRKIAGAAALALAIAATPVRAQEHAHGEAAHGAMEPTGSWAARAVPLLTRASPAMDGESLTEAYLSQPVVMGHARLAGGRLRLEGMLNLEGLTLRDGELSAGIWGEGFVDRRHPHTYLHEAVATGLLLDRPRAAASLAVGRGFAPFGTDDPMARPFAKYPANHHLAQILERLVAIGAVRAGPLAVEAGLFNGDEPARPEDLGSPGRFGDSWAARATLSPLPGLELQASRASVASPELPEGSGVEHRKWSASARFERGGHDSAGEYVLLEWARTEESASGTEIGVFATRLAEGAVRRRGVQLALRVEETRRPEEERLADPFRTPNPHADVHLLGVTRWRILTAALEGPALRAGPVRLTPFAEASRAAVEETTGSPVFDPVALYGDDRLWSLSLGARVEVGAPHLRMGRYGAALAPAASVH